MIEAVPMINRLIKPTSGSIEVDGREVGDVGHMALRPQIGYVFQGARLFLHLTVDENFAVASRLLDWPSHEIRDRVDELLEVVSLPPGLYRVRPPKALFGR